jgi:hypothetical protein
VPLSRPSPRVMALRTACSVMGVTNAASTDVVTRLVAVTANIMRMGTAMYRHLFHALNGGSAAGLVGQGKCVCGERRDASEEGGTDKH